MCEKIKIYGGKKVREEIEKIKAETYNKLKQIEISNDPLKNFKIMQETQQLVKQIKR